MSGEMWEGTSQLGGAWERLACVDSEGILWWPVGEAAERGGRLSSC